MTTTNVLKYKNLTLNFFIKGNLVKKKIKHISKKFITLPFLTPMKGSYNKR